DTIPVRDVITDGEDALIVSPNKTSVVNALSHLIKDDKLRETMGKRFFTKVFDKHTWTHNVIKILAD
ncbi:MAG: glycosyltransferase, partial [Flavobacteriales bacterium]